jgi:homoserine dehydrogenase
MTSPQQLEIDASPTLHEFPTHDGVQRNKHIPYKKERSAPALGAAPRTVRVALAGCGVVGGGLVRLLHESAPAIAARFGVRFKLTRVLVRDVSRERNLPLDSHLFTDDLDAFLAHDSDVVIEAVGGDGPARTIASNALRRGRKVITANKQLVASHGDTLSALALEHETGLDFGAAVGGSAPVISTLRDLVGAATPKSVRGILNGTSNYVISLLERGITLDAALASARERGLAESNCSLDLDGSDAAAKLAIIAWITFGIRPAALHIRRSPLIPGIERLVKFAKIEGACVRLIAECTQLVPGRRVAATVEPVIVAVDSPFGRTNFEENRVEVDLGWHSPLSVSGPGAGAAPTAAALLSDLLRVPPPPNDRGLGATQFTSVEDPREHRWLVTARLDAEELQRTTSALGFRSERFITTGPDVALVSAPVAWPAIQSLVAALDALNAVPCVARYEPFAPTEVLQ